MHLVAGFCGSQRRGSGTLPQHRAQVSPRPGKELSRETDRGFTDSRRDCGFSFVLHFAGMACRWRKRASDALSDNVASGFGGQKVLKPAATGATTWAVGKASPEPGGGAVLHSQLEEAAGDGLILLTNRNTHTSWNLSS